MHGAVAAGRIAEGYDSIAETAKQMARVHEESFAPIPENQMIYERLYREHIALHDDFGRGANDVMKRLKQLCGEQYTVHA